MIMAKQEKKCLVDVTSKEHTKWVNAVFKVMFKTMFVNPFVPNITSLYRPENRKP